MTTGVALVHLADDAPTRLRLGGRSPLTLIVAALESVRPPLEVRVGRVGEDRAEALREAFQRSPGAERFVSWDAAWPLAGAACVERLLATLDRHQAAVIATPVKATIKRSQGDVIAGGLPRERLVTLGGLRALRRAALARLVAQGAHDELEAGLDVAPVLDELAVVPVRDEEGARIAAHLLSRP